MKKLTIRFVGGALIIRDRLGVAPAVARMMVVLDKLPLGHVMGSRQLAERVGVCLQHVRHHGLDLELAPYRTRMEGVRGTIWASRKTITAMNAEDVS